MLCLYCPFFCSLNSPNLKRLNSDPSPCSSPYLKRPSLDWFLFLIYTNYPQKKSLLSIKLLKKKSLFWTSLVVQWIGIHLPMQGTWVWSLVQEDSTCFRAAKPGCHNYWSCALEPGNHYFQTCVLPLLKPMSLEPVVLKRSHHSEKPKHLSEEDTPACQN